MTNDQNIVRGRHLDSLAADAKRFTLEQNLALNQAIQAELAELDTGTSYDVFTGATSTAAGLSGLVPAPAAGDESKFLRGDGTWATVSSGSAAGTVLSTVPATVDGGLWFEMIEGNPYLKLFSGTKTYVLPSPSIPTYIDFPSFERHARYFEDETNVVQVTETFPVSNDITTLTREQIAWPYGADNWKPGDLWTDPTKNNAHNLLRIDIKTKYKSAVAERIVVSGTVPKCTPTDPGRGEYYIFVVDANQNRIGINCYMDTNMTAGDITSELRIRFEMPRPYETVTQIIRVTGLSATTSISETLTP